MEANEEEDPLTAVGAAWASRAGSGPPSSSEMAASACAIVETKFSGTAQAISVWIRACSPGSSPASPRASSMSPTWGVTSYSRNKWESLLPGDTVLFTKEKR